MALWERSDALARLEAMHRDTTRAGRVALVAGEAGIGKSTLIRAFADRCGARARVLVGLCDPLLTPRASGPLQDIAARPAACWETGSTPARASPNCSVP